MNFLIRYRNRLEKISKNMCKNQNGNEKRIFRSNHEQTNTRRKKEKEEDPDKENELNKEIIKDYDEDDIEIYFEEVNEEEHEKMINGLNHEQRDLYNYVVGIMEEQEKNRRLHGCANYQPCHKCDNEEKLIRLFITGEGKQ